MQACAESPGSELLELVAAVHGNVNSYTLHALQRPTWRRRNVLNDWCRCSVHCRRRRNVLIAWRWSNVRHRVCDVLDDGRRASRKIQRLYGLDLPVHVGHVERLKQDPRHTDEQRCGRMITCVHGAVRS